MRIPFARSQRSFFLAVLAITCALVVAVSGPARAFPTTASFTATDSPAWVAGTGGSTVHIDPGGIVSFSYPSGFNLHNVDFGALAPTSCAQTAPSAVSGHPMPASPSSAGWAGSCTFNNVGTYSFVCDLHATMRGKVLVGDVPEPPPTTGGGGGGGDGGTQTGGGSQSGALAGLKIAKTQNGSKVSGSISDVASGSALSIAITAKPSALKTSAKPVKVGSLSKSKLDAGTFKFAIKLSKKARAVIEKKGKLAVTVVVRLTPPGGSVAKATKSVTLKKT